MDADATRKLETLRADFAEVAGRPFAHFFCPLLLRDEPSVLCKAHIVNRAFKGSSRRWSIQRQDVDTFFGSAFEADFVDLQLRTTGVAGEAFVDPELYRRLRPKILLDGREINHFVAQGPIPDQFAPVRFEAGGREIRLGLKLTPDDVMTRLEANWQVSVQKDVRVAAFVSVLKSAHLTLFDMLGYRYALSPGGHFTGRILGQFFEANVGREKPEILTDAASHFGPIAMMVRPVTSAPTHVLGSIEDALFLVCWTESGANPRIWGQIVFVRTSRMLHAAMIPLLDEQGGAGRFAKFLESDQDEFETSAAKFEGDRWMISKERTNVTWPPATLD